MISYLGENKPNLISDVTSYLTELVGSFQESPLPHWEEYVN